MREKIIQAALEEMMNNGLKFQIRDIAVRLGISTKTIYQNFASKEEMIGTIVEHCIMDMKASERTLMQNSSLNLIQKLRQALAILPRGFVFRDLRIIQELRLRYPEHWSKVDDHVNQGWDQIRVLINEGVHSGQLRRFDVDLFIQVYVGALYNLMDYQVASRIETSLDRMLEQMVDFLMQGICISTSE